MSIRPQKKNLFQLVQSLSYLAPSLLLFLCFVFYPLLKSVQLSLFNTDLIGQETIYIGLQRYIDMFSSLSFLHSLWATLLFTIYTVLPGMLIALGLAYIANWQLRGIAVFQTIYLPRKHGMAPY